MDPSDLTDASNYDVDPEETKRDASESKPLDGSRRQAGSTPVRGRKLRWGLLATNVAALAISSLLIAYTDGLFGFELEESVRMAIFGFLTLIHAAPLLLAAILAAWGPWRSWIRGTLYLVAVISSAVVNKVFGLSVNSYRDESYVFLDIVSETCNWLIVTVPAIFCLVLIGSWLRLRIGQLGLPPVRVSILSVMLATAILGVVMSGTIVSNEIRYRKLFQGGTADSMVEGNRLEVLIQAAVAGPFIGLLLGCMAASAYRWWARLLLTVVVGGYMSFVVYMVTQTPLQMPRNQPNVMLVLYGGMMVGIIALCLWIPACIRLLDRSGWSCSRRRLGRTTTTQGPPVV